MGIFKKIKEHFFLQSKKEDTTTLLAIGKLLSNQQYSIQSKNIQDYEFKIFSQYGDDGIIQYLLKKIPIQNEIFIEFGIQDYQESNTRFMMMNNNWKGLVMDGSTKNIENLKKQPWFWQYDLKAKAVFITKENINQVIEQFKLTDIGLLHIDIDGNDYHILEKMDLNTLNPSIIIMEYNSVFGKERSISVPYKADFNRTKAHYSNLYFGASLPALTHLTNQRGYSFIGCNTAGNNAYYVRKDLLNSDIQELSIEKGFIESKFRESRDENYTLNLLSEKDRYSAIKGLPVINIITGKLEDL